MKEGQKLWTRDELILAINLYTKLHFGKMHSRNPDIKHLSNLLGRSPSSIARKLGNFASFDPVLKSRGVSGLTNVSKLDREIWNEFYQNWDQLFVESENQLNRLTNNKLSFDTLESPLVVGEEDIRSVKVRRNQSIFRDIMLANYDNQCCITGLDKPELLVAGHIVPWSVDKNNRLNPRNGLLLSALHDKAFENGYLTIDDTYKIRISSRLKKNPVKSIDVNFLKYEGKYIVSPKKFFPGLEFLKVHRERFKS
jgi:putative restriction endonuclease